MESSILNFFERTELIGILIFVIFISAPACITGTCYYLCLAFTGINEILIDAKEKVRWDIEFITDRTIVKKNKSNNHVNLGIVHFGRNKRDRSQSVARRQ